MSEQCRLYGHCAWCRTHPGWRAETRMPDACPHGITEASLSNPDGLGTMIERAVAPIAKRLGLPCYDEEGKLKPTSGCFGRKHRANALTATVKTDTQ